MKRELLFEDGSSLDVTIEIAVRGTMAATAFQRVIEFLDYELPDEPDIALQGETELLELEAEVIEEEDLEEIGELEEEWEDEEEWEEEEWEEEEWEEEEDLEDDWDEEDEDLYR
jgi:hypothetical protein